MMNLSNFETKQLTLPNGLSVLIAKRKTDDSSDDDDDNGDSGDSTSYIALSVRAGTYYNTHVPESHLTEHSIFLGSRKFPNRTEFDKFFKFNRGDSNGETTSEFITVEAEIGNESLPEAIERLGDMVAHPILSDDTISHEINMIQSEYAVARWDIDECHAHIMTKTAKKDHPFAHFSFGNSESLSLVDIAERVRSFHARHFIAGRIGLAIVSDIPFEIIEQLVQKSFLKVSPHATCAPSAEFDEYLRFTVPIDNALFNMVYRVVSPTHSNVLYIVWLLPGGMSDTTSLYVSLISWCMRNKSEGSFVNSLMKEGLVTDLIVSDKLSDLACSAVCYYGVKLTLTKIGVDKVWDILQHIYAYLHMLISSTEPDCIDLYYKMLAVQTFPNDETDDKQIARDISMQILQNPNHLTNMKYDKKFSPAEFTSTLNLLNSNEMNVCMFAQKELIPNPTLYDKWFQLEYETLDIPMPIKDMLQNCSRSDLYLPQHCEYLTCDSQLDTAVISCVSKNPDVLYDLLYMGDYYEKTEIGIYLTSKYINISAFHACLSDLYIRCLRISLKSKLFEAELAQLRHSLDKASGGLAFLFQGTEAAAQKMLLYTVQDVERSNFDEYIIQLAMDSLTTDYNNTLTSPTTMSEDVLSSIFGRMQSVVYHSVESRRKQLNDIQLRDFNDFIQSFMRTVDVQMMIKGSMGEEKAITLAKFATVQITSRVVNSVDSENSMQLYKTHNLPNEGNTYSFPNRNVKDENSVTKLVYCRTFDLNSSIEQLTTDIAKCEANLELLKLLIEEPAESNLRTIKGLAYNIETALILKHPVYGICLTVSNQEPIISTNYTNSCMSEFIAQFLNDSTLMMSEDTFRHYRDMAIGCVQSAEFEDTVTSQWNHLVQNKPSVESSYRHEKYLKKLTKTCFCQWMNDVFNGSYAKICVQIIGKTDPFFTSQAMSTGKQNSPTQPSAADKSRKTNPQSGQDNLSTLNPTQTHSLKDIHIPSNVSSVADDSITPKSEPVTLPDRHYSLSEQSGPYEMEGIELQNTNNSNSVYCHWPCYSEVDDYGSSIEDTNEAPGGGPSRLTLSVQRNMTSSSSYPLTWNSTDRAQLPIESYFSEMMTDQSMLSDLRDRADVSVSLSLRYRHTHSELDDSSALIADRAVRHSDRVHWRSLQWDELSQMFYEQHDWLDRVKAELNEISKRWEESRGRYQLNHVLCNYERLDRIVANQKLAMLHVLAAGRRLLLSINQPALDRQFSQLSEKWLRVSTDLDSAHKRCKRSMEVWSEFDRQVTGIEAWLDMAMIELQQLQIFSRSSSSISSSSSSSTTDQIHLRQHIKLLLGFKAEILSQRPTVDFVYDPSVIASIPDDSYVASLSLTQGREGRPMSERTWYSESLGEVNRIFVTARVGQQLQGVELERVRWSDWEQRMSEIERWLEEQESHLSDLDKIFHPASVRQAVNDCKSEKMEYRSSADFEGGDIVGNTPAILQLSNRLMHYLKDGS